MNQQQLDYGLLGAIGGGSGQIAGPNSGHVWTVSDQITDEVQQDEVKGEK